MLSLRFGVSFVRFAYKARFVFLITVVTLINVSDADHKSPG